MKVQLLSLLSLFVLVAVSTAQPLEKKPEAAYFEKFQPAKATATSQLLLKKGDRLAICGDSIPSRRCIRG